MTDTQVTQAIAEVAETATTVNTNVTQVVLEVAYTPGVDVGGASGTSTGGGGQTRGQSLPRGEIVTWTLNNRPAPGVQWSGLTARANGGYEQADLVAPFGDGRWRGTVNKAPDLEQGSIIRAYRENGDILWEGMNAAEPQSFQGQTKFWGVGAVEILRRNATRLPYQLAGGAGWVDRGSDPFNYAQNAKYDLITKDNSIGWTINALSGGDAYASGNKAGFALMVANFNLKRIAFTINKQSAGSADSICGNFDLELYVGDDAGSLTLDKSWTLGAGHPDGDLIDYSLNTVGNTISLVLTANGAASPGNRARVFLTKLRVNGIGDDDDWTTSDVVGNLGDRCDYKTNIIGSGIAAFPLDYEGSWADLATQMAHIDDWRWVVLADPSHQSFGYLYYGPYGGDDKERLWQGVQGEGLDCSSLIMLPRYNHVDVNYESPAGVLQTLQRDVSDVTDLTDPLPDGIFPYPEAFSLEDPQSNNQTARSLADAALQKLTKLRIQGSVTVSQLLNGRPYDILPGDLIQIGGFNPVLPPQRIASVTYIPGGTCRIDVERSLTLADIVAMAFRRRVRHRRS